MSTKEKFLKEIKEVCSTYEMSFTYRKCNGVPNGTINNLPNLILEAINITIPNEGVSVVISAKELIEYICETEL